MDLPNVRPGATSGTMQPLETATEPEIETIETATQEPDPEGYVDVDGELIPVGDHSEDFDQDYGVQVLEGDGSGEALPPIEGTYSEQQVAGDGQPVTQVVGPEGIASTAQVGEQNSDADGSGTSEASDSPQDGSEAGNGGDSTASGDDSPPYPEADAAEQAARDAAADDYAQNSTSSD